MKNSNIVWVALATGVVGIGVGILVTREGLIPAKPSGPQIARRDPRPVSMERKTVEIHADDPALGPASAPVTMVEFSDFQ